MLCVLYRSLLLLSVLVFLALPSGKVLAADSTKVDAATKKVETGARRLGQGVEETAKGIGNTVVEGAKLAGEKVQEVGKEAEPQVKNAWGKVKDGAKSVSTDVKNFVEKLLQ